MYHQSRNVNQRLVSIKLRRQSQMILLFSQANFAPKFFANLLKRIFIFQMWNRQRIATLVQVRADFSQQIKF